MRARHRRRSPSATTPDAVAVDHRTHTVYVANHGSGATGTVSVFDARTCNATDQAGCANLQTLQVPAGNPDDIAVNAATDTIYVATITSSGPDLVSVFNGATCNATYTGGCDQTPATVAVGSSGDAPNNSSLNLAVNQATNTIYASNVFNIGLGPPPFLGNSVYVINGATCDAANTTGCGQTPATVTLAPNPPIGSNPLGIAVDQATNTIYTANIADGEHPGTVSVINGETCNGQDTSGCGQTPATAPAGFGANGIAIDHRTNKVYVTNIEDTSVTMINGDGLQRHQTPAAATTREPTLSSATTQARSASTLRSAPPTSPTARASRSSQQLPNHAGGVSSAHGQLGRSPPSARPPRHGQRPGQASRFGIEQPRPPTDRPGWFWCGGAVIRRLEQPVVWPLSDSMGSALSGTVVDVEPGDGRGRDAPTRAPLGLRYGRRPALAGMTGSRPSSTCRRSRGCRSLGGRST